MDCSSQLKTLLALDSGVQSTSCNQMLISSVVIVILLIVIVILLVAIAVLVVVVVEAVNSN